MGEFVSEIARDGYIVVRDILSINSCSQLTGALPTIKGAGSRDLLKRDEFRSPVTEIRNSALVRPNLDDLVAVQCTLFKKSSSHNWSVGPHRDSAVPVQGTGAWLDTGSKDGMNTARPPRSFLERCLAVRIQLDGAPIEDISVVTASHLDEVPREWSEVTPIAVPKGGALVFRPTLVHASSKLSKSQSRRVLHYLFAPRELPLGYSWYHAI